MQKNIKISFLYPPILLTEHPECDFYQDKMNDMDGGHFSQILHFCGHLPVCRKFNSQEAFEIAKSNVEKYFTVVGITEQMQDSVTVMEAKLPKFFKGAVDIGKNHALKKYDQFVLNTSCFWGSTESSIAPVKLCNFTKIMNSLIH